ncbi:MAG: DNA translocase FtsK 4TM domain-containing protein [Desulfocapsaceae bacterium]|nr:DNA translocase FtsK 4TM domain-containing protein [Desulfocapsaceae bacterium]
MAQTKQTEHPGLLRESAAVLGIFIAAFLALALVSYYKAPPPGANWCGAVGAFISQYLVALLGGGSFFLAALLLLGSCLFFRTEISSVRLPQIIGGLIGAIVSFCTLLSCPVFDNTLVKDGGGLIGNLAFGLISPLLGLAGTVLTLLLLLLISMMVSTQFSPYTLIAFLMRGMQNCLQGIWGALAGNQRNERRENSMRERRVTIRKASPAPEPAAAALSVSPPAVVQEAPKINGNAEKEDPFAPRTVSGGEWKLPPLTLLKKNQQVQKKVDEEHYYSISKQLEEKLGNFGVSGKVIGISPGPVVTTYEYAPAPGIKINKIVGLADDLALGLKAQSVRVVGSVPGKAALGIEIPNSIRQIVYIRDLLGSENYLNNSSKLSIALGLDVVGSAVIADLARMPHLLIAGATGAGKSVAINTIIASILFNSTPEEVRFLMVDPKRIELSGYEGIPHLLHPVVVEPKMASRALQWAVREMERRYRLLEEAKVKGFDSYNENAKDKLPYIVVIVDELADLMMVASKDVEASIARLAQMARAAGIHLILATQRPSVDVLTGLIKANFPTRISFKVSSKIDSRTIIDTSGAEHLLGAGDMLYLPPGSSGLLRIHGAFISEDETSKLVAFLKRQGAATYDESVIEEIDTETSSSAGDDESETDDRYDEAVGIVCESGQASISMLQRRLRVGYNRAARMIEVMEKEGIIGPADGVRPREVLVRKTYDDH